jgi:hypothetical protein
MSNLLGSKPVDDLRLSQATWSKSENLLRNSCRLITRRWGSNCSLPIIQPDINTNRLRSLLTSSWTFWRERPKMGGRLSQFSTQWEKRTSNPWVLLIIRGGLELQFKQLPPLSEFPIPFSVSSDPHKRLRLFCCTDFWGVLEELAYCLRRTTFLLLAEKVEVGW